MNPASSSPESVEHFAEVIARLTVPFAVREAVLREAGLDERAWSQLEAQWTARLATDGALVDRYVARYAAVTTATAGPAAQEAPRVAESPVLAVTEAPLLAPAPFVERPAVVPPLSAVRIDGTLEPEEGAALRAVLPFLKGRPAAHITTPHPVQRPADPRRPDATLELGASLPLPLPRPR